MTLFRSTRELGAGLVIGATGGVLFWWALAALWIIAVING